MTALIDAAIVLAGGRGSRLGGVDKAELIVDRHGGATLLEHILAAVAPAPTVVVGPPRRLPAGVRAAREDPPGGGPAAAVAAGLMTMVPQHAAAEPSSFPLPGATGLVAVVAVDQPGFTRQTLRRLAAAARAPQTGTEAPTGAVLTSHGRRHRGACVVSAAALLRRVATRPSWRDGSLRELIDPLIGIEVPALGDEDRDIDTPVDLARWRVDDPDPATRPAAPGSNDRHRPDIVE